MSDFITVEYTYECPNGNYLDGAYTDTITETYEGYAYLYLIVNKETGIIEEVLREYEAKDGRPIPKDCAEVKFDCAADPLVAEVLSDYHDDYKNEDDYVESNGEIRTIPTPVGYEEFEYDYPIHPDELYNDKKSVYNFETGKVELYQNTNEDIIGAFPGWDEVRKMRDFKLSTTDATVLAPHWTDEERAIIEDFRQKLRDVPRKLTNIDEIFVDSCFPKCELINE